MRRSLILAVLAALGWFLIWLGAETPFLSLRGLSIVLGSILMMAVGQLIYRWNNSDVIRFAFLIRHGDRDHKNWLMDAAEAYVDGRPIPAVAGGSDKDRRIMEIEQHLKEANELVRRSIEVAADAIDEANEVRAGGEPRP